MLQFPAAGAAITVSSGKRSNPDIQLPPMGLQDVEQIEITINSDNDQPRDVADLFLKTCYVGKYKFM